MLIREGKSLLVVITSTGNFSASLLIYFRAESHKSSFQPFSVPLTGESRVDPPGLQEGRAPAMLNTTCHSFWLPSFLS